MARRYDQYCGLATVLDMVGDRWTLLIVRELLAGPRRYGDLLDGIPGVPTDMLANRLRHLEADGLVRQQPSPADGRMKVYDLTDEGRELEASVLALARFGLRRLGPDDGGRTFRTRWLGLAVRALYRPGAVDGELRVRFVCDGEAWQVRISGDEIVDEVIGEVTGDPHVIVYGRPGVLLAAVRDADAARALAEAGELSVRGADADVRRFGRAFRAVG